MVLVLLSLVEPLIPALTDKQLDSADPSLKQCLWKVARCFAVQVHNLEQQEYSLPLSVYESEFVFHEKPHN
jgi:hypothetical protein